MPEKDSAEKAVREVAQRDGGIVGGWAIEAAFSAMSDNPEFC